MTVLTRSRSGVHAFTLCIAVAFATFASIEAASKDIEQVRKQYVAEPTQQVKKLQLKVAGRSVAVQLPGGGNAGSTVQVKPGK